MLQLLTAKFHLLLLLKVKRVYYTYLLSEANLIFSDFEVCMETDLL